MIVWQVLIGNLACVGGIIAFWMHLQYKFYRLSKTQLKLGFGAALGSCAIVSMLLSVELLPGVYADLRSSTLLISAVFGGPLAIVVTAPVALAFRMFLGGAGATQGMIAITIVSLFGLLLHLPVRKRQLGLGGILALGGSAGLISTTLVALFAPSLTSTALYQAGPPVVLLNIISTTIMAFVVTYFHRFTTERDILRAALTQAPDFHYVKNLASEFIVTNLNVARYNGRRKSSEMVGLTDFDIASPDHAKTLFEAEQAVMSSGQPIIDMEERLANRSGKDQWFSTSKVVLRNRHGDTIGLAGVTRDITQRKMLEDQLQKSRDILSQAMEEMSDGLAMFDTQGYLVFCNEPYRTLFPRSSYARRQGAHISEIIRAVVRNGERKNLPTDTSEEWIQKAAAELHASKDEQIALFDGRWVSIRTRAAQDGSALVMVSDITVMKQSEQSLRQLADHMKDLAETDGLTGLYNRRSFDEAISSECARSARNGSSLSLLLIDVDHFKAYNDTYGHPAGDEVLKSVSECLLKIGRRSTDFVARYGGEEFVVLLPETELGEAEKLAELFRSSLQKLQIEHRSSEFGVVTACVGASATPGGGQFFNPNALIAQADDALYRAKREGRNRVHASAPENWATYPASAPAP